MTTGLARPATEAAGALMSGLARDRAGGPAWLAPEAKVPDVEADHTEAELSDKYGDRYVVVDA